MSPQDDRFDPFETYKTMGYENLGSERATAFAWLITEVTRLRRCDLTAWQQAYHTLVSAHAELKRERDELVALGRRPATNSGGEQMRPKESRPCFSCASLVCHFVDREFGIQVECSECHAAGPVHKTEAYAVAHWDSLYRALVSTVKA